MSILFYDDSPVFGGHEVMSLLGLKAVLSNYRGLIHFIASSANPKLCDQVNTIASNQPSLTLEKVPWHSSKLEGLRNRLQPARTAMLAEKFRLIRPALVVAIQGNIEHSSLALLAARRAGIPSTSYIPVPHSNAEMGARLGTVRDCLCAHLFHAPDSFITITDEMALLLARRKTSAPIHIVYNGVDTARFQPGESSKARAELGLPPDKTLVGMIGRIEFRQKQQQLLIQAIAGDPDLTQSCHLVFAGDGPDSSKLQELLDRHQLSGTLISWCDPAKLYQALDALIIPSRYEGLPLVMLEALATGTAVLGSDRDGMKDLLPNAWRFQPNNPSALAASLCQFVKNGCPKPGPALVSRVRETMSLSSFSSSFASRILDLAGLAPPLSRLQSPSQPINT